MIVESPIVSAMLARTTGSLGSIAPRNYRVSSSAFAADLNSGCVLLNLDTGVYYALDGAGTSIWELLTEGLTTEEIISRLHEHYDVNETRLRTDVAELLSQLEREGLVCLDAS